MSPAAPTTEAGPLRCAVHPARPGYDACPVCGRPRCHADAQGFGSAGCAACARLVRVHRSAGLAELLVRAGLAGLAVAFVGGWIATQYVRVHLMSLAAPALIGFAAALAVPAAARSLRPLPLVWLVAGGAALLGTAVGFVLVPGGQDPLRPWAVVGGPYLAALAGVVGGPLLFPAPRPERGASSRRHHRRGQGGGAGGAEDGSGSDL